MNLTFNWISAFGALVAVMMIIPELVLEVAISKKGPGHLPAPAWLRRTELTALAVGLALMVVPLGCTGGEFGYASTEKMLLGLAVTFVLMAVYYVCWAFALRRPTHGWELLLDAVTAAKLMLHAVGLRHWLLLAAGVVYFLAGMAYYIVGFWRESRAADAGARKL